MVHCGYEASAVNDMFGSVGGLARTAKYFFNPDAAGDAIPVTPRATAPAAIKETTAAQPGAAMCGGGHSCGCESAAKAEQTTPAERS